MINVIKRDGTKVPYDPDKILKMINWSTDGYDVNPRELYDKIIPLIVDGISTSIIQKQLQNLAASLVKASSPEWDFVAGNLVLLDLIKYHKAFMESKKLKPFCFADYFYATKEYYPQSVIEKYSKDEIEELSSKANLFSVDLPYKSINTFANRFLLKIDGTPVEAIEYMFLLTSMATFQDYGTGSERIEQVLEHYNLIARQLLSPATPHLSNLRFAGRESSPSCFILKQEDSLESIYETLTKTAIISKNGGASGVNLSSTRRNGSDIKGIGKAAKGVVPWLRLYNDTAVAVD